MDRWIAGAVDRDKWSLAQLISLFEDRRPERSADRAAALQMLDRSGVGARGRFLGVTGTPGAGKSSLIGRTARRLLEIDETISIAVLAVDPSSHVSGGAILGDRTRVSFPLDERRLFFRSQASDRELGGVSRNTFQVGRLLMRLFDLILVETVGIGQNEIEIQHIADRVYLVMQPMGGDQVQFMKAGIMEIPDVFIINKCDQEEAVRSSYHALRVSLSFARPGEEQDLPVMLTSAQTGTGIDALADDWRQAAQQPLRRGLAEKEAYYFERWVRDEYGRHGLQRLQTLATSAGEYIGHIGDYDRAQTAFAEQFPRFP